jgi:hypothetical protein
MKKYTLYLAALLAMISPAISADQKPEALQVEVLIFSGRPNPVFIVSDPAEIREIVSLAESLPGSPEAKASHPILGYNGIVVENLSTTLPDVQQFKVGRGDIDIVRKPGAQSRKAAPTATDASQAKVRRDGANSLETRLLSLARSKGAIDDRLLEHINRSK